jgi:hypothetical protein
MTLEERKRFNDLCIKVQSEQNPKKFSEYIRQLNDLLVAKERRFSEEREEDPVLHPPGVK